jgi:hypothetical protein
VVDDNIVTSKYTGGYGLMKHFKCTKVTIAGEIYCQRLTRTSFDYKKSQVVNFKIEVKTIY